ncbi:Uncharacterised protein [Chlamydia trachomatis]|nr:Uncharacterised protein [Chlamydia trachomatis]
MLTVNDFNISAENGKIELSTEIIEYDVNFKSEFIDEEYLGFCCGNNIKAVVSRTTGI